MTLRTSFFNKTVFFKTIKRYWPLWAGYLLLWIMCLPVDLHETMQWRTLVEAKDIQRKIYLLASDTTPILSFLAAPLAAMAAFSHLYNDRSCGAYASLPLRRENMFISVALAGLVPLLVSNILVFGATLWAEYLLGCVEVTAALTWLAVVTMEVIAFYGFAVLCAQLTGHAFVVPVVYALLSFTAVVVQSILYALFQMFLFGYQDGGVYLTWLSPLVEILQQSGYYSKIFSMTSYVGPETYIFQGWGTIAAYCGAGIASLVGALFLFKKRRMESAGDIVAVKILKPVFKYCLAGGCALVLGVGLAGMFYREDTETLFGMSLYVGLIVTFLICGGIGYFAAEMLNRKTFRAFKGAWKGYIVFALVAILGLSALEFDFFGFEKRVPKAEKVENVSIYVGGHAARSYTTGDVDTVLGLHEAILDQKTLLENTKYGYNSSYVSFYYTMKNGRIISRGYHLPVINDTAELVQELEDFMNSPAIMETKGFEQKNLTPEWFRYCDIYGNEVSLSLTQQECYDFYTNYLLPDMQEGKISRFWLSDFSVYREQQYDCEINMAIEDPNKDNERNTFEYLYVTVTTESTRVLEWFKNRGVELKMSNISEDEYDEKYGELTSFPDDMSSSSIGVIGSADGPTTIVVS